MPRSSLLVAVLLLGAACTALPAQDKLKALIVDGQNNHAMWPKTTVMMKQYLEETELFTVDVARTAYTWRGDELLSKYRLQGLPQTTATRQQQSDPNFKPRFFGYDVVVSNYNGAAWPSETQQRFVDYVSNGGGFVVVHAANNAFGQWKQYNEIIGLGGWGGRDQSSGPYIFLNDDGQLVRDEATQGRGGSHGQRHPFQLVVRDDEHPITRGMPRQWMHSRDELYDKLRGPAENMRVLATAYAAPNQGGTGRHEPMMMTIQYGKGRVFHTPMGHDDVAQECVGFIVSLQRGAEWAATGKVTQTQIPADFPAADQVSRRKFD